MFTFSSTNTQSWQCYPCKINFFSKKLNIKIVVFNIYTYHGCHQGWHQSPNWKKNKISLFLSVQNCQIWGRIDRCYLKLSIWIMLWVHALTFRIIIKNVSSYNISKYRHFISFKGYIFLPNVYCLEAFCRSCKLY